MKKVLSVALASAMVLGMGANAFAITYSTGSNEEASWPKGFAFDGKLFVTNADDELIEESTTRLNDSETVDFEPGDTIWMPLYAKNQIVYDSKYQEGTADKDAVTTVQVNINTPTVTHVGAGLLIREAMVFGITKMVPASMLLQLSRQILFW